MKWGIISPNSMHFKRKMQYVFRIRDCVYGSRNPGSVELEGRTVQTIALEDLFKSEIDAVYICSPTDTHESLVELSLYCDFHVLCEKSFAIDESAVTKLQTYAEEHSLRLRSAFQGEFNVDWDAIASKFKTPFNSVELNYTMPLGGRHPNLIEDVGYYAFMVSRMLTPFDPINKLSCLRINRTVCIVYTCGEVTYVCRIGDNDSFEQSLRIGNRYTGEQIMLDVPFTCRGDLRCYEKMVENFENDCIYKRCPSLEIRSALTAVKEKFDKDEYKEDESLL